MDAIIGFSPELAVDCKNSLGESLVWDDSTGLLYWIDIEGKSIWRLNVPSGESTSWALDERPGCIALREQGGLLVALDKTGMAFFNSEDAVVTPLCPFEADVANTRANDGRCDRQGRFLIGGYNEIWRDDGLESSGFYRLDTDGTLTEVLNFKFRCANGTCFSPDGRIMYLNDSPKRQIWAFDYDTETGTLSNQRVLYQMAENETGVPDGAQVDSEGFIWVAYNGGGRVARHSPVDGSISMQVNMPWKGVTTCTFGGDNFETLYITTNRRRMTAEEEAEHPHAGGLYFARIPGISGLPEPKYRG